MRDLRDRVRTSDIRRKLTVELLIHCIEMSQLRQFRRLISMRPGRLSGEMIQARSTERRPRCRPRISHYIFHLDWECLGIPQEDAEDMSREKELSAASLTWTQKGCGKCMEVTWRKVSNVKLNTAETQTEFDALLVGRNASRVSQ